MTPRPSPPPPSPRFAPPYALPTYPFTLPPELRGQPPRRYPVAIVGAGPAGLTLACDLAQRGVPVLLLDEDNTVGVRGASSRGICYAQKSLELLDCLGAAEPVLARGVSWSVGRTFSGMEEVYAFNLQTHSVSAQPPFINLQQFHLEAALVERLQTLPAADLRWCSRVTRATPAADHVQLQVQTPEGEYTLEAGWLVDATGANSPIRTQLGLETHAARSTDRWCISDVRFSKPLPVERWTWVDAPFNEGRGVWQHLMADGVWRIDYQMPEDVDADAVSRPEVAAARLREQLGPDVDFEFVWIGPYQYRDHLLDDFRHGRMFFLGDAAHVVSPFGARGGNTGMQDAFNLGWKLALVLQGQAGEALLDSYSAERRAACVENLEVTRRSARFLAPRSAAEHRLRRAVLDLARHHPFARTLVNTGRMSVANDYPVSAQLPAGGRSVQNLRLQRPDGQSALHLMHLLRGHSDWLAFCFAADAADAADATQAAELAALEAAVREHRLPLRLLRVGGATPDLLDADGQLARQLGVSPATTSPGLPPGPDAAGPLTAPVPHVPHALHVPHLALLRPDAYLAATPASAADLVAFLRQALARLHAHPLAA